MVRDQAVASPGVEIFGIHELVLNANNKSGYKDVYPVSRKKRPWQAKVWDTARQSHMSLGSFGTYLMAPAAAAAAGVKRRRARGRGGCSSWAAVDGACGTTTVRARRRG